MRITTELLHSHGACEAQVALFARLYPEGLTLPRGKKKLQEVADTAGRQGLLVVWAVEALELTLTVREWHENGQLAWEREFRDGKLHGAARAWHANGQLALEREWRDGQLRGAVRRWNDRGELL